MKKIKIYNLSDRKHLPKKIINAEEYKGFVELAFIMMVMVGKEKRRKFLLELNKDCCSYKYRPDVNAEYIEYWRCGVRYMVGYIHKSQMYVYSQVDLKCDDCVGDNDSDDCVRVYFNKEEFLEKCNSVDINPNDDCYNEIEAWERKDIDFFDFLKETQAKEICQD